MSRKREKGESLKLKTVPKMNLRALDVSVN
jgi:hypothetical protein